MSTTGTVRLATSDADLAALVAVAAATTPEEPTTLEELPWANGYVPQPDGIILRGPLIGAMMGA